MREPAERDREAAEQDREAATATEPDRPATGTRDRLALDEEAMRRAGYHAVDLLVELLTDIGDRPALTRATPSRMQARLGGPPPAGPSPVEAVLDGLARDVLPFASRPDHPRYFAFVPTSGTWPGALGDLIASALNIYAGAWMESAGPSQVELEVVRWFADWIGYPADAAGILVSGGSAANLTALACAREARLGAMSADAVAYVSAQAHSSVARAARVLGFRPEQVRILPVDDDFRMRPDILAHAIAADRASGLRPLLVSASAGATNTGTIDHLDAIADVCDDAEVWFHVDAAYGGFAALTARGRGWLQGIHRADSVTLDPHKWLYQSFECGCLLVRDGQLLQAAFAIEPDYLHDAGASDGEVNFSDLGMQLSRASRALKVWLSVHSFGLDAFRATIDDCLDLAADAERRIREHPELELLHPACLGIVCFRRRPPGIDDEEVLDTVNARLVADYAASGHGLVSSTRLGGRYAIRLCVLNHTSGPADVAATLDWLASTPLDEVPPEPAPAPSHRQARDPDVAAVWARPAADTELLAGLELFATLDAPQRAQLAQVAWAVEVEPGETVVRRFEVDREFYVVVDGRLEAFGEADRRLAELGPGDFFGELAARDWGAGYGYPRLATVIAATPARLVALPGPAFNELLREAPEVERRIRRASHERLARL
jgi:aromatic-L-amino-acid/L-tryptophan decarboxylase